MNRESQHYAHTSAGLSSIGGWASGPTPAMRHVAFAKEVTFASRDSKPVTLDAGLYRVEASDAGQIVLVSDAGTSIEVPAARDWHDQPFDQPVALDLEGEHDHSIALLLPGGLALHATGSYGQVHSSPSSPAVHDFKDFHDKVFTFHTLKFADRFNPNLWTLNWGKVVPATPAAPFVPASFPPNWVSTRVVTCFVPPAGSYGPGGPGTASGVPPFNPGDVINRGPFKGYYVSTTNVTATVSPGVHLPGKTVELLVTAHVVTLGIPTILSMTWQDTYRIVASANGPVTFPDVVLATGRTPTSEPPGGTTWAAQVQERLYSSSGRGVPTVFELRVDSVPLAEETFYYFAGYAGGPPPEIRP
jgi:hypothetical protein